MTKENILKYIKDIEEKYQMCIDFTDVQWQKELVSDFFTDNANEWVQAIITIFNYDLEKHDENKICYIIKNVKAIHQDTSNICWAVTATILLNWNIKITTKNISSNEINNFILVTEVLERIDNKEAGEYYQLYFNNSTLSGKEAADFFQKAGFVTEVNIDLTPKKIYEMLKLKGPLIVVTNEETKRNTNLSIYEQPYHLKIIYGICMDVSNNMNAKLKIIDPYIGPYNDDSGMYDGPEIEIDSINEKTRKEESFTDFIRKYEDKKICIYLQQDKN
ncbi:MAG: papain-like cysteine protease family protein [Salinivirgaceae bacterium]|jgi:hypothetical protein|nr:hypothetical protein [Bacteroidales bacterium]